MQLLLNNPVLFFSKPQVFLKALLRVIFLACFVLMVSPVLAGGVSVYEFDSEEQRETFRQITQELRCPKCQNQSVGDSDAPIAGDIRDRVYEQLKAGQSSDQIIDHMIDRYGQFVTYRPAISMATAVLWFGPPLLVLIVLFIVFKQVPRKASVGLDENEQALVEKILKDHKSETVAKALKQESGRD